MDQEAARQRALRIHDFRRVGTGTSLAAGAGRFGSLGRNVFHGPGDITST